METEVCSAASPDWKIWSIEEVCQRVTSGGTPSRREPVYYADGCWPWVKTQELQDEWIDDTEEHITEEAIDASSAKVLPKNTVLLAMYGATVGQLGLLRKPMTCNQACCAMIVDEKKADFRYLFYQLLHARPQLKSLATGAAQQNLSGVLIKSLGFPFPHVREQRAIAHILGTLDDKIELNRRMNGTLEQVARVIFKSWFVDFDPVYTKAEGRKPAGMDAETAGLFPDAFQDSALGKIPKGWEIATLVDHFDAVKGVSYKGSGLSKAGMPLHNLNSIYEGGGYKYEGIKYYNGEFTERHLVEPGDVIVANTEQGHDRLLIGYAAIVPRLFGERGIASHHIYRLRSKPSSELTAAFLCQLLNSAQMHDVVSGYANGTTVNMLPIDGVQKPQIVVPPGALITMFDSLASQLEARREEMVAESRTLAAIRDALLPKLLSGEIRVGENVGASK